RVKRPLADFPNQSRDRRAIAKVQTRLDALGRGSSDQLVARNDLDVRQSGRILLQRLHLNPQTSEDDPAEMLATGADDVDGRRRAEIDDDQVRIRIEMSGADRVCDAVGADFDWIAIADLQPGLRSRLQDERVDGEILAT